MAGRLGAWLARPEGTAEACLQAFDETIRPERAPGALVESDRLHLPLGGRIAAVLASGDFSGLLQDLSALQVDISQLEEALEAAGAPWTPGRRVPPR